MDTNLCLADTDKSVGVVKGFHQWKAAKKNTNFSGNLIKAVVMHKKKKVERTIGLRLTTFDGLESAHVSNIASYVSDITRASMGKKRVWSIVIH